MVNLPLEGGLNYQTPVLMLEQWWRTELRTTAKRVTSTLNSHMLPAGQYVDVDSREFLAPSFKEHAETWVALVAAGLASVEEARAAVLHTGATTSVEDLLTPPSRWGVSRAAVSVGRSTAPDISSKHVLTIRAVSEPTECPQTSPPDSLMQRQEGAHMPEATDPERLVREVTFAVEGDGRTIEARIVPYNTDTQVVDLPQQRWYRSPVHRALGAGSLRQPDRTPPTEWRCCSTSSTRRASVTSSVTVLLFASNPTRCTGRSGYTPAPTATRLCTW